MKKEKLVFIILFMALSLLAFQVSISKIIGSSQSFTLFELIAPIGGMFLGPLWGGVSAFVVRLINVVLFNQKIDLITAIRFLPAVFAAAYFGIKSKKTAIIFPICIALFLLNPIGRQAWQYSAIWLIPFIASFKKDKLILNSLGSTFTAHAIGSVIFLYTVGLTPAMWLGLIPVVFVERGIFTAGIWLSAMAFDTLLSKIPVLQKFAYLSKAHA